MRHPPRPRKTHSKTNNKPRRRSAGTQTRELRMSEQWKDIPDFEGYYQVSDAGRVRSLGRTVPRGNGSMTVPSRLLTPVKNHRSGLRVSLRKDGVTSSQLVHRLVLLAFVGPCPDGMECCHNDGNNTNNRLGNLRWDTHSANMQDKFRHGTHPHGERHSNTTRTDAEVREMRELYRNGMKQHAIAERFGTKEHIVQRICSGKRWRHVS